MGVGAEDLTPTVQVELVVRSKREASTFAHEQQRRPKTTQFGANPVQSGRLLQRHVRGEGDHQRLSITARVLPGDAELQERLGERRAGIVHAG